MMKNTLNKHTTRLDIDTCSFFITNCEIFKYGMKSRAGSTIECYDNLGLTATQILVKI